MNTDFHSALIAMGFRQTLVGTRALPNQFRAALRAKRFDVVWNAAILPACYL